MNGSREVGNARSTADATISKAVGVLEAGKAHGTYRAEMLSPVPQCRDFYNDTFILLKAEIGERRATDVLRRKSATEFFNPVPRMMFLRPRAARLIAQLRAVPFEVRFAESFPNVITTVGANEILDKYLAGSAYTAALNMFLKGTGVAVIADTMGSHGSWLEVGLANAPVYSGNRPAPAFSAASGKSKAITTAQNFTFTSGGTVAGACFVQGGSATKDNTTGTLLSAGDFASGSKAVLTNDQINVSWSMAI